ncbi:MAG: InlB B-repeat-containing protein, partial [Candidatus Izemoplasmatales bacterium]|nr:InlB B-repeat-containing protein [Candidatus Izemoplasmatales bacterium]
PYVTGIIALLISYDPGITYDEMITRLFQTAQDYGDPGFDPEYGHGIIDAYDVLSVPFYQVSFVTDAPDDVAPVWVKTGNAIAWLPHPEYPEHVFKGWYVDPEYQVSFDPDTIILNDITLYAKYSDNYHLIHLFDGDDLLETITVEHESSLEIPVWEKAEYVFVGWYLDPDFLTPYASAPIEDDLTLYAKYDVIVYHDLTVYLMGVVYDVLTFREGDTPHLDDVMYFGYDFEGYYLDEAFVEVYDFEPIMTDVVVYARIVKKIFTITLVINAEASLQIIAPFQEIPELPEVTDETKEFAGWYYDATYQIPYLFEPITDHLTLFAKFMDGVHRLDIIIDSDHSYVLYVESGTTFAVEDPEIPGWVFTGWFVDQARTSLFSETTITEDWTLYAGFEMQTYEVNFYAEDLITIIHREAVHYHEDAIAPTPPVKASTPAFDFVFREWSEDLIEIESNLDVYPLYDYTFKPESVRLMPAVDTYGVGQVRALPGVELLDSLLSVETIGTVNHLEAGRYAIEYHIMNQDVKVYELRRIIHLIDAPRTVEIHLNPGITTLRLGEVYVESGAISSQGNVEIIGDVNTEVAGVYVITYRVSFEDETYEKKRYVYVTDDTDASQSVYYVHREDDEDEI